MTEDRFLGALADLLQSELFTTGVTRDGSGMLIPNAVVAGSTVENLTHYDRIGRVKCTVGVAFDSDLKLVRQVLEKMLDELPWRCHSKNASIYLSVFGASSVEFTIHVWIDDVGEERRRNSDLHEAVWWALEDAGITIAFPQVDVHFDEGVVDPRPPAASHEGSNPRS